MLLKIIQDVLVLSQSALGGGGGSSFLGTLLNSALGAIGGGASAAAPAAGQAFATPTLTAAKGAVFPRGRYPDGGAGPGRGAALAWCL